MVKDAELDRLKTAQDNAFASKQRAYDAQVATWQRRKQAGDALNRAYEAKQSTYASQDATWQDYQRVRSYNGPRIEQLNTQQERAFQNMKSAFDSASAAHNRRDGASASSYASQGHAYKAESQGYVAERRQLVDDIRSARARHEDSKPAFQRAKDDFGSAKRAFDSAKADHERAQTIFKRAKADFDQSARAFKARLEKVRTENNKRKNDKRSIADRAGIPHQYRDDIWVSKGDSAGSVNIYFGGAGRADGPGHGHYTLDRSGTVTYKREPYDPHGAQNFTENRRESATLSMARMAMNQWAKTQTTPWATQHEDSEFKVQVKSGHNRQHDCIVTDVLIYDKQNKREHYHLVISDHGQELYSEWRPNRTK